VKGITPMYKLLIVDDEEIVREGLKDIILYLNLEQISEIKTANDGLDAIAKLESYAPHIILTDLNMPHLGGVSFIEKLMALELGCKLVVISGYDEFHLVKESFKLGVTDYLLKPVHTEELREALSKMIISLEYEREQQNQGSTEKNLSWIDKVSREINSVIGNVEASATTYEEVFERLQIPLPYSQTCVAIITSTEGQSTISSWTSMLAQYFLAQYGEDETINIYPFYNWQNDLALWINADSSYTSSSIDKLLEETLTIFADIPIIISRGELVLSPALLKNAYYSAYECWKYKLTVRPHTMIDERVLHGKKEAVIEADDVKKLIEMIDMSNKNDVIPFIQRYFGDEQLKQYSMDSLKKIYDNILRVISWHPNETRDFYLFSQGEKLRIYLKTCMFQTIDAREHLFKSYNVIEIAKRYVQEHLLDEINMAIVANYCNVSYHYFSKMFKENTGTTFQDYVTKTRMEYAKNALSSTHVKINEVAEALGYSNPKNFTRVFKNYYGVGPKSYQTTISKPK